MQYKPTESNAGKRFTSGLVDYFIIFGFTFGYVMLFGEPNAEGGKTVSGLPALVPVAFWFCWTVLPETLYGTTFGHYVNGLKVLSVEGIKPSPLQSLKRRLCDAVEITWCFGLIAFVLIKNTALHQRLGDIWAKTVVVPKAFEPGKNVFEFEANAYEVER